jgi:hypothetical protein
MDQWVTQAAKESPVVQVDSPAVKVQWATQAVPMVQWVIPAVLVLDLPAVPEQEVLVTQEAKESQGLPAVPTVQWVTQAAKAMLVSPAVQEQEVLVIQAVQVAEGSAIPAVQEQALLEVKATSDSQAVPTGQWVTQAAKASPAAQVDSPAVPEAQALLEVLAQAG